MSNVLQSVEDIVNKDRRYHFEAYTFTLKALNYTLARLGSSRHVSAAELLEGIKGYARQQFGPMARVVLEHWNVFSTQDFGNIVFNLIDVKVLKKTAEDKIEDFKNVYDFKQAFR